MNQEENTIYVNFVQRRSQDNRYILPNMEIAIITVPLVQVLREESVPYYYHRSMGCHNAVNVSKSSNRKYKGEKINGEWSDNSLSNTMCNYGFKMKNDPYLVDSSIWDKCNDLPDFLEKTKARSDIIFYDNWSDIIGGC